MTDPAESTRFSLRRWSRRKHEAARKDAPALPDADAAPPVADPTPASAAASASVAIAVPQAGPVQPETRPNAPAPHVADAAGSPALPPVESLSIDSDFSPFMQPGVDESLKRSALKKLFSDPRFNVMDGLDVYIDDYSKPDPIDPAIVRTLAQARYIFAPPKTRVNEHGHVEDVPDEPPEAAADQPLAPPEEPTLPEPVGVPPAAASAAVQQPQIDAQPARSDADSHDEHKHS